MAKIRPSFRDQDPPGGVSGHFALANGAVQRGQVYLSQYPGFGGKLLFLACTGSVFMAGAKILDCIKHEAAKAQPELAPELAKA